MVAVAYSAMASASMTRDEYAAAKKRITADYEAHRQKCGQWRGNNTDICVANARGERKAATAELQAEYRPGPRAYHDAAIARADAAYGVARQECDDSKAEARKACLAEASAARSRAREEAAAKLKASRP